jgi:hypothetical protein
MKLRISHGQATRSTLIFSRVIHFIAVWRLLDVVGANLSLLWTVVRHSYKQPVQLRDKNSSASAGRGIHLGDRPVIVRIDLVDHIDFACATDHINVMTFDIVENIVGVAGYFHLARNLSRIGIYDEQPRWHATTDE